MKQTEKNKLFYRLLRAVKDPSGKRPLWTLEKIAEAIYVNRSHLTDVINGKPGHGGQTRPKLAKFFKANFEQSAAILQSLGWDEEGNIIAAEEGVVPRGTLDVQQSNPEVSDG